MKDCENSWSRERSYFSSGDDAFNPRKEMCIYPEDIVIDDSVPSEPMIITPMISTMWERSFRLDNVAVRNSYTHSFHDVLSTSLSKMIIKEYNLINKESILKDIRNRLEVISRRQDNWDKKNSKKPTNSALLNSRILAEDLLDEVIDSGYIWKNPFISSDEDGNVTFEWHKGKHELHIEVGKDTKEFIKIWGTNINYNMCASILDSSDYANLWDWLLNG